MKKLKTALLAAALTLCGWVGPASAAPQQPAPEPSTPQQQSEFVPVEDLPQAEQLPAAPLVITAYSVAWLATLAYLWSIWRRLQKVDRELEDVSRRLAERVRS